MALNHKSRANLRIALAALVLGAMASEAAFAGHRHRHGARIGVYIGAPVAAYPFYRPYHRPFYRPYVYSPYYYPPVVMAPVAPPVYIEQPQYQQRYAPEVIQPPVPLNPQFPQPQPQSYQPPSQPEVASQPANTMWYYCAESRAYYPHVQQCAAGWQQVTPQPQG